jgi:cytochrome c oxidase subunit 4
MSDPSETIVRGGAEMTVGTSPPPGRGHTARHPSPKEYIRIALILAVITALEVAVYYVELSHGALVGILFAFSLLKFALVVLWFMHLKFDSRTYARFFVMGLAGAVTLFLIVLLTFRVFQG